MAEVNDGIRKLQEADLIPEDDYNFRVLRVRLSRSGEYEIADLAFEDPQDPELVNRRVSYFLGSPTANTWRGLRELLKAAKLLNVPEDKETGKRDTMVTLQGTVFPGRLRHRDGNQGPENNVQPIIDNDWVASVMSTEGEEVKPRRRRRRSTS